MSYPPPPPPPPPGPPQGPPGRAAGPYPPPQAGPYPPPGNRPPHPPHPQQGPYPQGPYPQGPYPPHPQGQYPPPQGPGQGPQDAPPYPPPQGGAHGQGPYPQGQYPPPNAGQQAGGPWGPQGQLLPPVQYAPPPPSGKRTGLFVVGAVIGLVVVLIGGGAYLMADSAREPVRVVAHLPSVPPITSVPIPSFTPPPITSEPTPEPTPEPTGTSTPEPTASSGEQAEPGSPFSERELDDWNFKLGTAKFDAKKVGGWDYDSCGPVDGAGKVLAKNDCERASQIAYSAYGGELRAVLLVLSFPGPEQAEALADRLPKLPPEAVKWRKDQVLDSFAYGKVGGGDSGSHVVYTVVTATKKVASAKAQKFQSYLQSDIRAMFVFRGAGMPD